MLSILISCYNYDCRSIAHELSIQCEHLNEKCEIIVGDDASPNSDFVTLNSEINGYPYCRYEVNEYNLGRAAHRNSMAKKAKGEWLLFIDCDSEVCDALFLTRYLKNQTHDVVCGGLCTPDINPCPKATLRYKYEQEADKHRSADERNMHPYMHLTFFNLMIRKDVFMQIKLDENCREYGYEDALFGVELNSRNIAISHIDNPLMHVGLEPNDVFLDKSETALRTLSKLNGKMKNYSHVENAALKLSSYSLDKIYIYFYNTTKRMMRKNLLGKNPSLFVFSLYKLGYYLCLSKNK